jgi:hypothetical protein
MGLHDAPRSKSGAEHENGKPLEAARETAYSVLASLENRAAHPAIIYGPECGRDGITIN